MECSDCLSNVICIMLGRWTGFGGGGRERDFLMVSPSPLFPTGLLLPIPVCYWCGIFPALEACLTHTTSPLFHSRSSHSLPMLKLCQHPSYIGPTFFQPCIGANGMPASSLTFTGWSCHCTSMHGDMLAYHEDRIGLSI